MKRSFLLSLAGMAGLMVLPLHGQQPLMKLEEEVEGIRYGLYEDEDCLIPLVDEEDHPVEIISGENGILTLNHQITDPYYLRQSGTVRGYYYDPQIYSSGQDHFILPVYPIEAGVDCGECREGTFQIYEAQKEVMVMEWSLEDCENPSVEEIGSQLEAGKEYVLVQKDLPEWMYGMELPFQVPEYAEEKLIIKAEQMMYGSLSFHLEGLKQENGFRYQLFEDEECSQPAEDIDGNEVKMEGNGTYRYSLPEGSYWLKAVNQDLYYLPVSVQNVSVTAKQEKQVVLDHTLICPVVTLLDEKMHPIKGSFEVSCDEEEEMRVESQHSLNLKRNRIYTITPVSVPAGYYFPSAVTYETVYENGIVRNIDLTASSFTVILSLKDQQTDQAIGGAEFGIYDEAGKMVCSVRTVNGEAEMTGLEAGKSYRIHQTRTTDAWLPVKDQIVTIPVSGDPLIHVALYAEGYVHLRASIVDDEGSVISDGVISVFDDPLCTVPSVDIHGRKITSTGFLQSDVHNGTYYVKLDGIGETWYMREEAVKVQADHSLSSIAEASVATRQVDCSIVVKDDRGNTVDDFVVDIYSGGKKTGRMKADGTTALKQGISFSRNTDYLIRPVCLHGQYVFDEKGETLSVSKMLPIEMESMEISVTPYVGLHVLDSQDGLSTTYQVYTDSDCTKQAADLIRSKDGGKKTWNLADGTYWVKTESIISSWYPDSHPVSIVLDHTRSWNENVLMEHAPVTVVLSSIDEDGKPLSDAMVEIRSMDGAVQQTGTFTEGLLVVQGSWLCKGESYVVSEIQTPDGYHRCADVQFTVPSDQPSMLPSITIPHQKKQAIILVEQEKTPVMKHETPQVQETVESKKYSFSTSVLPGAVVIGGVLISAFVILKNISKRKV